MNVQSQATPYYPFALDGPLCPLLNDAEVLSSFYAEERLHHSIKQFCKRTTWPGKPAVSYAVDPEKLKELLISLFNSPVARAALRRQGETGRCAYLDNAIWQWLTTANPTFSERLSGCCDDIKGKLFMSRESWVTLLAKIQSERPGADTVTQLAYVALAFAMLQEDDRYTLGEAFLSAFPEYKEKMLGP
jgi:predicted DNA-binding protein (MmcQ/YjbR family)